MSQQVWRRKESRDGKSLCSRTRAESNDPTTAHSVSQYQCLAKEAWTNFKYILIFLKDTFLKDTSFLLFQMRLSIIP